MREHRYLVLYGSKTTGQKRYILWDTESHEVVYQDDSKSPVIAEAQRRNGFEPVDGSEVTYGSQTK